MENNLGIKLQEIRKQNKLSQETLAEKLGVSRQAISKWERGESAPDTENLIALSRIYGVSIDELLGNKKSAPPESGADNLINQIYKDLNDHGRAELERYGNYLRSHSARNKKDPGRLIRACRGFLHGNGH